MVRVLERVARLDARSASCAARVLVAKVVHVAGRDDGQAALLGELQKQRVDALLHVEGARSASRRRTLSLLKIVV